MAAAALRVDGVHFSYGRSPVLFGVSLHVDEGEVFGLLGTNGAGKSTLLRVIAGLEAAQGGTITMLGQDVTATPAERMGALGLGLVMGGKAVFPELTVRENFLLGGQARRTGLEQVMERELDRFPGLKQGLSRPAASLSGGEQQQLAIAMALTRDPTVLCIDELSLGLAPAVVAHLFEVVEDLKRSGVTCILVEQSLSVAAELCDRAVFMEKGTVRFEGRPADLLSRGDLARAVFLGGAACTT